MQMQGEVGFVRQFRHFNIQGTMQDGACGCGCADGDCAGQHKAHKRCMRLLRGPRALREPGKIMNRAYDCIFTSLSKQDLRIL